MIIFISDGRLGNQLFQYSFLRSISNKNEIIIVFNMNDLLETFDLNDIYLKNINIKNYYLIKIFTIFFSILCRFKIFNYIYQKYDNDIPLNSYNIINGFLPIKYVKRGYFQSEDFINKHKLNIYFKKNILIDARNIINKFNSRFDLVFVHVRRGDYINEMYKNKIGIDLPLNYYYECINQFNEILKNPFYIFTTDDREYVLKNFNFIRNKYISSNSMEIDLALISLCPNGIVSNSSFSWWGAFLIKEKKIIFFPEYWWGWKSQIISQPYIYPNWAIKVDFTKND